jgi:MoaA/NifB/PqqE/SkfB family radical SAM enzyme
MKICTRVGIDVTWRCNWKCDHCFYLRNDKFHTTADKPLDTIFKEIEKAGMAGLDHVVLIGQGEPSLHPDIHAILDFAYVLGMATSIITNGSTGLEHFKSFYDHNLDHLHISSHGFGDTLNRIVHQRDAFDRQGQLKGWLRDAGLPFRTNVTLQKTNYRELKALAEYECKMGVTHFVFLGFLPHYEWHDRVDEIAVHPALLGPRIEEAADVLIAESKLFTIRYHPLCYLRPDLWKYVVNAKYVPYDPFEWNYNVTLDPDINGALSYHLGESIANKCDGCKMRLHCGGWNKMYAKGLGVKLPVIREIPDEYASVWDKVGGLHDMNPANQCTGTLCLKE